MNESRSNFFNNLLSHLPEKLFGAIVLKLLSGTNLTLKVDLLMDL